MEKIYKIGIIGYGGIAVKHRIFLEKGDVRATVKGVYDINPERTEAALSEGYIAYKSVDELLSDKEIDIVLVSTSNEVHKDLSIKALRAGKHVLCEKPVTLSSDELLEVMTVANETGLVFTINQNRRVDHDFMSMWRAIDNGLVGKPYVIESRVEGSRGVPRGWRTTKALGGGMLYDWGVHLIDQIMYMCKEKVISVYCKMFSINFPEVDDNFRLTMEFDSGLVAHIEVSTNSFIKHNRFYVYGTEGSAVIHEWDGAGKVVRKIAEDNKWDVEIKEDTSGPSKTMAARNPVTVEEIELTEPLDVENYFGPTYKQMISAIEGEELKIKPEEALRVLKVIEAAFESNRKNTVVKTNI